MSLDQEVKIAEDKMPPLYADEEGEAEVRDLTEDGAASQEDPDLEYKADSEADEVDETEDSVEDTEQEGADDDVDVFAEEEVGEDIGGSEEEGSEDGEDEVADLEELESEDEDDLGEDTEDVLDYKRLWLEERQRLDALQQQFTSGAQAPQSPQTTPHLDYRDPYVLKAIAAIQSNDPEQLQTIDPQTLGQTRKLIETAEETQKEMLFNTNSWVDRNILPVVDEIVRIRLNEFSGMQKNEAKHGKYLSNPKNASRFNKMASEIPGASQDTIVRFLKQEDKIADMSRQRNKATKKAKHAKRLVKDTSSRMTSKNGRNVKPDAASGVRAYKDTEFGAMPKSMSEIAAEILAAEK